MIPKKRADAHERIMKNIETAHEYFNPNYNRYNEYIRFVFDTAISDTDRSTLEIQKKPQIEFNLCEAHISKLRGEFAEQEPSIEVMSDFDTDIDPQVIKIVEGHFKHILFEANKNSFEYSTYTNVLAGGFSAMKVWTEYGHSRSFDQVIRIGRVFDPTLVGFDPMCKESHKGDADYCFELFPRRVEDFKREFPNVDMRDIRYNKNLGSFNWYYTDNRSDIILVADYYEKEWKRVKIVKLANGRVMTADEYEKFLNRWQEMRIIEQPSAIVSSRMTDIEVINRYMITGDQVIKHEKTDYPGLPIIFVDGNSQLIKDNSGDNVRQMTRPYVYNARGMQKLVNYAGQCLANELENMVMHKFMVPIEAVPDNEDLLKAWTNYQIANVLTYKAFKDNDPNMPLPPPTPVPRIGAPPEMLNAFASGQQMIQNILGAYDASLGINDNQLSGKAIIEGATQSNKSAMPYVVGFLQALDRSAQLIVKMIPKYYKTLETIPIIDPNGKRGYARVNQQGAPSLEYSENALQIRVKAGVNFAVQKDRALQQIISLSNAMPVFAQFMNTKGLPILLDNLEIRGGDLLKVMGEQFAQEMQQQAQQQAQMAMQMNPVLIKAKQDEKKLALQAMKQEDDKVMEAAKIGIDQLRADNERLEIMLKAGDAHADRLIQKEKHDTENFHSATELAIKAASEQGKHHRELTKLEHEILQANKEKKNDQ